MFAFNNGVRVFISTEVTDMRCSFDALSQRVTEVFKLEPLSGHLFVFFNRNFSSAKLLFWERGGFWLFYRRLEKGRFHLPVRKESCRSLEIEQRELFLLLEGLELDGMKHKVRFIREAV
jgi:transposase